MGEVRVQLARIRRERGLGAAALAKHAGISRQTIYAMEAGSYVPNTTVALRLARVLDVPVEALFSLEQPAPPRPAEKAELLCTVEPSGAAVQVARLGGRLIAVPATFETMFLPEADGLISGGAGRGATRSIELARPIEEQRRLVVAGCDPALSLLSRPLLRAGVELIAAPSNSTRALEWLRRGRVHIAGSHLLGSSAAEANLAAVRRAFPHGGVAVITLAIWEQGFITACGNPKGIRSVADLARPGVRLMNRERGSGSRRLLDRELNSAGVAAAQVEGYYREAAGHLPAARTVRDGEADCCVATRAAANAFGLHFAPLRAERYDLAVPESLLGLPAVVRFFEMLGRADLRRELETLACYDVRHTGERVI